MSFKSHVGVLAHHQPRTTRPTSFIPYDQAELLVSELVAERVSRRIIRMFEPSSVFMAIHRDRDVLQDILPSALVGPTFHNYSFGTGEIPGLRFDPPASDRVKRLLRIPIIRDAWQAWKAELTKSVGTPRDTTGAARSSMELRDRGQIPTEAFA